MKKRVFKQDALMLKPLVVFVSAAIAGGAMAQSSGGTELEQIVVTAQKRTQSVQTTPMAISVISGADIAEKGMNTVDEVLKNVPGVEVQGLAQGAQVYIRGVGSSIDPTFADPSIAMMIDGAYLGRTEAAVSGTYDVDRVEVLAGPQGTLYGRNASGGAVNVITANPKMGVREGMVREQIGNYGLKRLEGNVNTPINEDTALRVAGFREKRDGYLSDGSSNQDNYGLRAKLRWAPNQGLSVIARAEVYHEDTLGANTVPVPGSAGNLTFPPPIMATNFVDPATNGGSPFLGGAPNWKFPNGWTPAGSSPWQNDASHAPGYAKRDMNVYSLQIDKDLDWSQLTVLPTYARSKNTLSSSYLFGTLSAPSDYDPQTTETVYRSLEVRLASPAASKTKWLVGGYLMDIPKGGLSNVMTAGTAADGVTRFYTSQATLPASTQALFGQVTQPLTDATRITGGLRFSRDKQGQNYSIYDSNRAQVQAGTFNDSVNSTQYKLGFEHDVAARSMVYGHVATGFKQGGLSPSVPPVTFAPERLTAYEVGTKNRFLDNRLQLNASLFYYDYKNYQLSSFANGPLGSTGLTAMFPAIFNAGDTSNKGAEVAMDWRVTPKDKVRAGIVYLDAKYGKISLPNNPFVNQGEYSLEGKTMQNSPRMTGTFGYEHIFSLEGGELTASVNTKISQGYYTTPEQYLPGAWQSGYHRTDASVRYNPASDSWSITGWVKNIENQAQTTYVFPAYRRFATNPRTFGITAEQRF